MYINWISARNCFIEETINSFFKISNISPKCILLEVRRILMARIYVLLFIIFFFFHNYYTSCCINNYISIWSENKIHIGFAICTYTLVGDATRYYGIQQWAYSANTPNRSFFLFARYFLDSILNDSHFLI